MPQLKERVNFSIDRNLRSKLERAVPRSRRSAFVEAALDRALEDRAREELVDFLDSLPTVPVEAGNGSVEAMRAIRQRMQQNAADALSSNSQ